MFDQLNRTARHGSSLTVALAIGLGGTVAGQTITVDTPSDVVDFAAPQTVAELPGPDGRVSLREAGLASDNTAGVQTIAFNVPQAEWTFQWLHPGRCVLNPFLGFRVFDTAIIDATTQTAFSGETNPDGGEVVVMDGLSLVNSTGGIVAGFDNTVIGVSGGSGNEVRNNSAAHIGIFDSSGNLVTGNTPGDGYSGGTIKIDRADDNVVVGNTVQRVRVLGFGSANPATGNRIGGPDLADRNFITGYGYVNGEGLPGGTTVQLFSTQDTLIENNWIGTTPDGLAQGSLASSVGIGFESWNSDVTIRNNRIAGILGHGQGPHHAGQLFGWAILVGGGGSGVTITGNTIGLDANDEPLLGSVWGIDVGNVITSPSTVSDIRIGGALPGEGNVVAGHILNGITIGHEVPQVRISGTTVYDNGWLGIDLIPSNYGYGATANDPLDADAGGNGLQNFPVITTAVQVGASLNVVGGLHSEPFDSYTIELFATDVCDDSGFGEGRTYLGATTVATDARGDAAFDVTIPAIVPGGWLLTSTATLEPLGATSEFSACVPVDPGDPCAADMDGDGNVGFSDLSTMLSAWGSCAAPCPADMDASGHVGFEDLSALLGEWGPCT